MKLLLTFCFLLCLPFFIVLLLFLLKFRVLFLAKFKKLIFAFLSYFFPEMLSFFSVKLALLYSRFPSLPYFLRLIFLSKNIFTSVNTLILLFAVGTGASVTFPALCLATLLITLNLQAIHRFFNPVPTFRMDKYSKALLQSKAYDQAHEEVTLEYTTKVDAFLENRSYLDSMLSESFNSMVEENFTPEATARHEEVLQQVDAQLRSQKMEMEDEIINRASSIYNRMLDEANPYKIPPAKIWTQISLLILTALTTIDPSELGTFDDENSEKENSDKGLSDVDAADFS